MLYNTTYRNDHDIYQIDQRVGKAFSFLKRLRMGGIGSKRMSISAFSPEFQHCQLQIQDSQFGFLELRPKGVLVLINKQLQNFTWPIPYPDLQLDLSSGDLRVNAEGNYVHFKDGYLENEFFVKNLLKKVAE